MLPMIGHSFGDWQETVAPTCLEAGSEIRLCSVCKVTETCVGRDPLGHNYSFEWTMDLAPSCHTEGSQSRHCTRCSETTDRKPIVTRSHTYDDGIVTVEPTCEQTGTKVLTCTVCQNIKALSLEKLPPVILGEPEKEWKVKSGEHVVFRSAAALVDFLEVRVNGKVVPRDCYILREGSTIVELTPEYLKTLEGGAYTIEIVSTTGIASASFDVVADEPLLWLWILLGLVMVPIMAVLVWLVVEKVRQARQPSMPVRTLKPVEPSRPVDTVATTKPVGTATTTKRVGTVAAARPVGSTTTRPVGTAATAKPVGTVTAARPVGSSATAKPVGAVATAKSVGSSAQVKNARVVKQVPLVKSAPEVKF